MKGNSVTVYKYACMSICVQMYACIYNANSLYLNTYTYTCTHTHKHLEFNGEILEMFLSSKKPY